MADSDIEFDDSQSQSCFVLHEFKGDIGTKFGTGRQDLPSPSTKEANEESKTGSLESFLLLWQNMEDSIRDKVEEIGHVADDVKAWIGQLLCDQQMTVILDSNRQTTAMTESLHPMSSKLPTALLSIGSLDWSNHSHTVDALSMALKEQQCAVALLPSKILQSEGGTATGMDAVKYLISQFTKIQPETADMDILSAWHTQQGSHLSFLVVIVEDAESCDIGQLASLVHLLCEWRARLPLVLVLGFCTSPHFLQNGLPAHISCRLKTVTFHAASWDAYVDAVVRCVFLESDKTLLLPSGECVKLLFMLTQLHSNSLSALIGAIKMILVEHFYVHGGDAELAGQLSGNYGECPSPQARDTRDKFVKWKASLQCLHTAGKVLEVELPAGILSTMMNLQPGQSDDVDHGKMNIVSSYSSSIRCLKQESVVKLMTAWLDFCDPAFKPEVNAMIEKYSNSTEGSRQSGRQLASMRALLGARGEKRGRSLLQATGVVDFTAVQDMDAVVKLFEHIVKNAFVEWGSTPWESKLTLSPSSSLKEVIAFRCRSTLASSLLQPQLQLGCTCCEGALEGGRHLPATCLAYSLSLQNVSEGAVNIAEWYQQFEKRVNGRAEEGTGGKSKKKKRKVQIGKETKLSSAMTQALFVQATSELQLLGVVQPLKRRPNHAMVARLQE